MKVIKQGNGHIEKPVKKTCGSCNSKLEYTRADIKSDQRDGDYIICPVCDSWMSVRSTNYSYNRLDD